MPRVEVIDPASIPTASRGGGWALHEMAVLAATENLQKALRGTQALKIVLDPDERAAFTVKLYRDAAKAMHIGVAVVTSGRRSYRGRGDEERFEAEQIWVRIVKASTQMPRRPVLVEPAKPVFEPITHCEISR